MRVGQRSRNGPKGLLTKKLAFSLQNHATGGYFLHEDVALFDAAFFRFTSEVASVSFLDPFLSLPFPPSSFLPKFDHTSLFLQLTGDGMGRQRILSFGCYWR